MKNVLLATSALVAFAGAAAADVSLSGSGKLGYNDDVEGGIYTDANVTFGASAALDNGYTAAFSVKVDLVGADNAAIDLVGDEWKVSISNDMYGLYFGDYDRAAHSLFTDPEGMSNGMREADDGDAEDDILLAKGTFGEFTVGVSYDVDGSGEESNLSVGVSGAFNGVTISGAYQEEGVDEAGVAMAEATAVSAAFAMSGATIEVGYADIAGTDNYGIEVGYPVGPVALSAWYASNDDVDVIGAKVVYSEGPLAVTAKVQDKDGADTTSQVEAKYTLSDELSVAGGYVDGEGSYVAATFNLGGGASLLASYADADTEGFDEVGDAYAKLKDGITVQVSMAF